MRMSFSVEINVLTGFAVSFVDSRDTRTNRGNRLLLPRLAGQPYIPSSTIRGRLRHTTARMVLAKLAESNHPKLTLADIAWMTVGGIKQGKDQKDDNNPTADIMLQRPICSQHMLSFWGFAEPLFQESRLQIEHARPAHNVHVDEIYGQRTDPIQRGSIRPEMVSDPESFDGWHNRIAAQKAQASRKKAAVKARKNPVRNGSPNETNHEAEEEKEAKIVAANMPFGREIVPPDTAFTTHFDINNASDLQVGMFAATLRAFAERPVFGAQAGMNLGLVDMEMTDASSGETIVIKAREQSFRASKGLADLERAFWKTFPRLDWTMPSLKK